tara:strand:- start:33 stop:641 length:609 start_codon:yes stop_codon:yes gene_type:complete
MNRQMNIKFFIIIFLFAFLYSEELSKDLLDKIEIATEDINKAPDFSLKSIQSKINDGKITFTDSVYTLSKMENKVILLNFWATWCGPCRLEIPDFNELYEKYNEKGLEILGISIQDTKEQLQNFSSVYTIEYPLLYGSQIEIQKLSMDYGGIYTIPVSILIGPENEILRFYPGAILKQYDPNMYADLIYNIESSISNLKHEK